MRPIHMRFLCRIGGVELVTQHGKIKVENTLDTRLSMMSHQVRVPISPCFKTKQFLLFIFLFCNFDK